MSKKLILLVGLWVLFFVAVNAKSAEESKAKSSLPSPNQILATYLYEAKYSNFPPEVIKKAKYLILDSIGCALGGVQSELGHRYLNLARNWGGGAEATILGFGLETSVLNAAYVNTQLANLLDFDDTYDIRLPGHPGCIIIQTALALGQKLDASGEDILTAVILGYEISLRLGRSGAPILWQLPVGSSSIILGPGAASCKLLKLDPAAIIIAFRYAQSEEYPPTRWKHDYPAGTPMSEIKGKFGAYSMAGILAALQAQQGLTTNEGLLDGDLESWFFAGGDPAGYDIITQKLGSLYRILEMSFKPTPSCRFTHVPITAAWEALNYQPVKNEDISEILVKGVERLNRPGPDSMIQAQFSVPTVIALAITGVEPGPKWYLNGRFKDPEIVDLAKKVKFENDPEAVNLELKQGKMMSTVKIVFKDGTVKQATCKNIKGSPGNPLSEKELEAKFKANAAGIMSDSQINRIIKTVMELEKLPRIGDLLKMLVSSKQF